MTVALTLRRLPPLYAVVVARQCSDDGCAHFEAANLENLGVVTAVWKADGHRGRDALLVEENRAAFIPTGTCVCATVDAEEVASA